MALLPRPRFVKGMWVVTGVIVGGKQQENLLYDATICSDILLISHCFHPIISALECTFALSC